MSLKEIWDNLTIQQMMFPIKTLLRGCFYFCAALSGVCHTDFVMMMAEAFQNDFVALIRLIFLD